MRTEKISFPVVGIGASAGGLEAVTEFLTNLSPSTGMAYIYAQHLSPDHKNLLVELLSKHTTMKVVEAVNTAALESDHFYIIPYNFDITVKGDAIKLLPRVTKQGNQLPIDLLFSSIAMNMEKTLSV